MTHKNSAVKKCDDFKTLNCTSSALQKIMFLVSKESSVSLVSKKKKPTHLEFCGESYDQISEQRSDLPRISESTFLGSVVAV